jgi:hypothetical protein
MVRTVFCPHPQEAPEMKSFHSLSDQPKPEADITILSVCATKNHFSGVQLKLVYNLVLYK